MSIEGRSAVPRRFVTLALPWLLGAAAFLLYAVTLNKWLSLYNLGEVARVSGWLWRPELQHPLTWLILYPFGWLPQSWIPLALNLFAAGCASAVLVLLARSVALLRHDLRMDAPLRNENQSSILSTPTAWIPPVLAATVCGLQLSFWEHATSFTGSMIDLLVFAYVIRCLLEFRIDQDKTWFSRCALIYGAGMANDWALVGYFPVLVAAILWITGFQILYDKRWLLRVAAWGLAGMSLYLLLPACQSLFGQADMGFWTALKANLKSQKDALSLLRRPAFRVLAFTSLLPVIVLSIRWKSHTVQFNDDSRLGVFLTKATVHFVHALFFVCGIWMALDPAFSPRHLNLGMPMLTYYYTGALVVGYCAGHFLLMGTGQVKQSVARFAVAVVFIMVFAVPAALAWRNLGQIGITNGRGLREFAEQLREDLPAGKSVALSDDPREVFLLQAELASGNDRDAIVLEIPSLTSTRYHRFLANRFKSRWTVPLPTNQVETVGPGRVLRLVSEFAQQEPVLYLHPTFGRFFERFRDRPNGLVHYLEERMQAGERREHGEKVGPGEVSTNEQIWQKRWTYTLQRIVEDSKERRKYDPSWAAPLLRILRLSGEQNITASFLGSVYAKSLNYWGVQMQRTGRWAEAGVWFAHAIELNADNVSAQINMLYNKRHQAGGATRMEAAALKKEFQGLFVRYENWREILNDNGPVDEPTVQFEMGKALLDGMNTRQAATAFSRCMELAPEWLEPQIWLALSYLDLRDYATGLELAERIKATRQLPDGNSVARVLLCRTTALEGLGRTNEAAACVENFAREYNDRGETLLIAADIYMQNMQFQHALVVLDHLLGSDPTNLKVLSRKGWAELELSRYEAAAATLMTVVSRAPADENARLNLAIARMGAGQFDAARADYQELLKKAAKSKAALFGLAGVAWHKHETNIAVDLYQQFLSNSVPETAQYAVATERLKRLKGEK